MRVQSVNYYIIIICTYCVVRVLLHSTLCEVEHAKRLYNCNDTHTHIIQLTNIYIYIYRINVSLSLSPSLSLYIISVLII